MVWWKHEWNIPRRARRGSVRVESRASLSDARRAGAAGLPFCFVSVALFLSSALFSSPLSAPKCGVPDGGRWLGRVNCTTAILRVLPVMEWAGWLWPLDGAQL